MAETYPVKYINEAMRGAPVLNGQAGTLVALLDAFLITGFGQVTALSVNVASGVATAMLTPGQSFAQGAVVLIAGATPAALNGEARVLTASSTSITWATTAPDGAATGAITIKVAPVGWEKKFSATNKAVYRSTDPLASGFCLRVDDAGTIAARVRGYEAMTDVDTGTGPFPTDAQISGGGYQFKSNGATANPVRYDLIADSRTVLIAIAPGSAGSSTAIASPIRGFGDMLALRSAGDVFSAALSCSAGSTVGSGPNFYAGAFDYSANGGDAVYTARAISGLGGAQRVQRKVYVGGNNATSGADNSLGAFPSAVDGELKTGRCYLHNGDDATPRADIPGVLHIPQTGVVGQLSPRDMLLGAGALAGRTLLCLGSNTSSMATAPSGIVLVDITGPWR